MPTARLVTGIFLGMFFGVLAGGLAKMLIDDGILNPVWIFVGMVVLVVLAIIVWCDGPANDEPGSRPLGRRQPSAGAPRRGE